MCKFCELELCGRGTKMSACPTPIGEIRDGSQVFDVYLNRYISEPENIHESTLVLNLGVDLEDANYSVQETQVKIKYCPFCGEEL